MDEEMDHINIVPLLDIMLVLLTIVLTTATFVANGRIPVLQIGEGTAARAVSAAGGAGEAVAASSGEAAATSGATDTTGGPSGADATGGTSGGGKRPPGKKPPRKAGTTAPTGRDAAPKIKIDVYDDE